MSIISFLGPLFHAGLYTAIHSNDEDSKDTQKKIENTNNKDDGSSDNSLNIDKDKHFTAAAMENYTKAADSARQMAKSKMEEISRNNNLSNAYSELIQKLTAAVKGKAEVNDKNEDNTTDVDTKTINAKFSYTKNGKTESVNLLEGITPAISSSMKVRELNSIIAQLQNKQKQVTSNNELAMVDLKEHMANADNYLQSARKQIDLLDDILQIIFKINS